LPVSCVRGPFLPLSIILPPPHHNIISILEALLIIKSFDASLTHCLFLLLRSMWMLSSLITMAPIIPGPPFGHFNFVSEFLPDVHFGEAFNFGGNFSFLPEADCLAASSLHDEAFEYDNISCNFSI
jgi:hypothetical protein